MNFRRRQSDSYQSDESIFDSNQDSENGNFTKLNRKSFLQKSKKINSQNKQKRPLTKRQQEKKLKEEEEYVMRLIDGIKQEKVQKVKEEKAKVEKVSVSKKNNSNGKKAQKDEQSSKQVDMSVKKEVEQDVKVDLKPQPKIELTPPTEPQECQQELTWFDLQQVVKPFNYVETASLPQQLSQPLDVELSNLPYRYRKKGTRKYTRRKQKVNLFGEQPHSQSNFDPNYHPYYQHQTNPQGKRESKYMKKKNENPPPSRYALGQYTYQKPYQNQPYYQNSQNPFQQPLAKQDIFNSDLFEDFQLLPTQINIEDQYFQPSFDHPNQHAPFDSNNKNFTGFSQFPSQNLLKNEAIQEEKIETKIDKKERRQKILVEIQKLREQFYRLEDEVQEERSKTSYKDLSDKTSLSIKQVKKLHKEWKYDPHLTKIFSKIGELNFSPEKKQKNKSQCRLAMLEELIKDHPFMTQYEMADTLRILDPALNERLERSAVLRLLKSAGITKNKISQGKAHINQQQNVEQRFEYVNQLKGYQSSGYNIFYYDELIINEYFDRELGWCKQNEEVVFKPEKFISTSLVLLIVLGSNGLLKWNIKYGNYDEQQFCQTFSSALKSAGSQLEKNVIVVNPRAYRNPEKIAEIVRRRGWELMILPSQPAHLNPLQSYFSELKQLLKRKKYQNMEQLFESVVEILNQNEMSALGQKIMQKLREYIQKAQSKEPI